MGSEGAVNVIFRRELQQAEDPEARRQELIEEYEEQFGNPYFAAERGYVDDVIEPAETRREADPRAPDAAVEARAGPAAQARQHPAVTGRRRAEWACGSSPTASCRPRKPPPCGRRWSGTPRPRRDRRRALRAGWAATARDGIDSGRPPRPGGREAWQAARDRRRETGERADMTDDRSEIEELEPGMTSLTRLPWEEARLLVGRLESQGLQAEVFPDPPSAVIGGVLPMPALDANLHDVLVETARLDEARAIAKDIVQG